MEASRAFGGTRLQTLVKVQIPQAMPTIMAGVNQTLMMAMAMGGHLLDDRREGAW